MEMYFPDDRSAKRPGFLTLISALPDEWLALLRNPFQGFKFAVDEYHAFFKALIAWINDDVYQAPQDDDVWWKYDLQWCLLDETLFNDDFKLHYLANFVRWYARDRFGRYGCPQTIFPLSAFSYLKTSKLPHLPIDKYGLDYDVIKDSMKRSEVALAFGLRDHWQVLVTDEECSKRELELQQLFNAMQGTSRILSFDELFHTTDIPCLEAVVKEKCHGHPSASCVILPSNVRTVFPFLTVREGPLLLNAHKVGEFAKDRKYASFFKHVYVMEAHRYTVKEMTLMFKGIIEARKLNGDEAADGRLCIYGSLLLLPSNERVLGHGAGQSAFRVLALTPLRRDKILPSHLVPKGLDDVFHQLVKEKRLVLTENFKNGDKAIKRFMPMGNFHWNGANNLAITRLEPFTDMKVELVIRSFHVEKLARDEFMSLFYYVWKSRKSSLIIDHRGDKRLPRNPNVFDFLHRNYSLIKLLSYCPTPYETDA